MQVDLAGKVALITGGAQGIGQAIAHTLAANQAQVVLVDIDIEQGRQTAAELHQAGYSCQFWEADVTDFSGMETCLQEIVQTLGGLDILVNNAGINTVKNRVPIHQYNVDDWHRIIDVDLNGVFAVSRAAIPALLKSSSARIINISSIGGLVPLRLQSAFIAAKAGVINLTKSMALELGPQGVLVNAVAPGSTLTRGTEALFYGSDGSYTENAASLISHIPLGRPGNTTEIAHAVLFLAAPESSYITGTVLTVDGGWTAGYTRDW